MRKLRRSILKGELGHNNIFTTWRKLQHEKFDSKEVIYNKRLETDGKAIITEPLGKIKSFKNLWAKMVMRCNGTF